VLSVYHGATDLANDHDSAICTGHVQPLEHRCYHRQSHNLMHVAALKLHIANDTIVQYRCRSGSVMIMPRHVGS